MAVLIQQKAGISDFQSRHLQTLCGGFLLGLFFCFVWVLSGFVFCLFFWGGQVGYYIIIKKKKNGVA